MWLWVPSMSAWSALQATICTSLLPLSTLSFTAQVGPSYFRLHPKGVGLVCTRKGGLQSTTFVEEYLGEIHPPWRWFEIQVCDGSGGCWWEAGCCRPATPLCGCEPRCGSECDTFLYSLSRCLHMLPTLQDAVKKVTGDELPDFYNIALERPQDDPGGYDVLYVDGASKVCGDRM